jgi:hypothetical protein
MNTAIGPLIMIVIMNVLYCLKIFIEHYTPEEEEDFMK